MNIGEANDSTRVIEHLLRELRGESTPPHIANRARQSAATLADRAHKALSGGLRGEQILDEMRAYCADRFDDIGPDGMPVPRYCIRTPGHTGWHDDMDVVWPNEAGDAT